jgi:pimeloyl-ACP methyl ester carboxylesterase
VRQRRVATNGIELSVVDAGPEDGPLVILLHGFPEFSYAWREQIGSLAAAGWRVLAPDQRGYHTSDKPPRIRDYRMSLLVADVIGLIDAHGRADAVVIGHDWGGVVAWSAAQAHPDRVRALVAINAPHPGAMRDTLRTSRAQRKRSKYFFWFQLPMLPEWLLRRHDYSALRRALVTTAAADTFSAEDLSRYLDAWSSPGAVTGMLNWYRAMRFPSPTPARATVAAPTLLIWGVDDVFLGEELVEPSLARCADGQLLRVADAGHWVQHEHPQTVATALSNFLGTLA